MFITRQSYQKFCSADKEMEEQLAKKIMEEASRWEKRQARLNLISLADSVVLSEEKECSQVRDKIVDLAEFLICSKDSFITSADFRLAFMEQTDDNIVLVSVIIYKRIIRKKYIGLIKKFGFSLDFRDAV